MGGVPGSRHTPSEDGSGLEEADRDQITCWTVKGSECYSYCKL